jgi:hypothetical protein
VELPAQREAEQQAREEEVTRRKAERENEELPRRLTATESTLEAEKNKPFWARVFGR